MEGRQILDAVLIANEVVDEKRRSGEEGVVFKIDFEKAYDHVEWGTAYHYPRKAYTKVNTCLLFWKRRVLRHLKSFEANEWNA